MKFLPCFFNLSGMNAERAVTCWVTPDGQRGTAHSEPISISAEAMWPALAGVYTPAERPARGNDISFFRVDHANPDCDQLVFDTGERRP